MENKEERSGFVGPLILIGLGVIFLLNNLGVISWNIWMVLLRLWPILLVAVGLDLLFGRRSVLGSLLAMVLTLIVIGGALWLISAGPEVSQRSPGETIKQRLDEAERAEVNIGASVGTLQIEALPESAYLVEGKIWLPQGESMTQDFTLTGKKATFTLGNESTSVNVGPFIGGWSTQRFWKLGLNPDVPLQLDLGLGMGETDIDLSGLTVDDLETDLGIGEAMITLPEEGHFQARIESAIGQTTIYIPEGMAARVHIDTGIAGRSLPQEYQCQEDLCTSPGYETADNRVELEVSQAIGHIAIRQK